MYSVVRASIQISTVEGQENAVWELKSSETAVPREWLSHQQYVPIPKEENRPFLLHADFTQVEPQRLSHSLMELNQNLIQVQLQLQELAELGFFSNNPFCGM